MNVLASGDMVPYGAHDRRKAHGHPEIDFGEIKKEISLQKVIFFTSY